MAMLPSCAVSYCTAPVCNSSAGFTTLTAEIAGIEGDVQMMRWTLLPPAITKLSLGLQVHQILRNDVLRGAAGVQPQRLRHQQPLQRLTGGGLAARNEKAFD